jgi:hypothetical protein
VGKRQEWMEMEEERGNGQTEPGPAGSGYRFLLTERSAIGPVEVS